MGSLHAWQSVGDGTAPDVQAIAKGLGGGYVNAYLRNLSDKASEYIGMHPLEQCSYLPRLRRAYAADQVFLNMDIRTR